MSIMLGNGLVAKDESAQDVTRTVMVRASSTALPDYFTADVYDATAGAARKKVDMTAGAAPAGQVEFESSGITLIGVYNEDGTEIKNSGSSIAGSGSAGASAWRAAAVTAGNKYFIKYSVKAIRKVITISGDTFPGTYYVTGDTYARSDVDGKDQFFQFIIPKAKMTAENTITLEAEGDPSTFNMNLTVLRPEDGEMMKLVQYDLEQVG